MYSEHTEEQIKKEMLDSIATEINKNEGSLVYDAISPAAIKFAEAYIDLGYVADKLDIENLEGEELAAFAYQRTGLTRKPATKSSTTVTITGREGAVIRTGDLVASDTVVFVAQENKAIGTSGQMQVLVECEQAGSVGNVPARAIKYFPVSIPGLISVTNPEPVTNGYDAESDKSLLERYYERIRTPATSGNRYHYLNWAKEVTGVGDARVIPLWAGDNTVKVVIIDSNKQPTGPELVAAVQEHIDPGTTGAGDGVAPIGAFCTVASATGVDINVTAKVTRDASHTLGQVKASIEDSIAEYLKSIAFVEDTVSYARIGALILDSDGVIDYQNLSVNGLTANIAIADDEVAVLGEVVISE